MDHKQEPLIIFSRKKPHLRWETIYVPFTPPVHLSNEEGLLVVEQKAFLPKLISSNPTNSIMTTLVTAPEKTSTPLVFASAEELSSVNPFSSENTTDPSNSSDERDCNMAVPQDASIASSFPGLQLLVPKSNRIKPVRLQEIRSFLDITATSHSALTTFSIVL
ncbi:hypothetical protein CDAR_2031 [Caerostris darwini]|uniref:Uncharacterized protein n=1 Tax=Caerostris darwini TaxID=1538125 RepID=A0AAV4VXC7_9ARAC|nr:hypothetical protein CDAR_2031 [Caerostris darwini]